jgi:DNA invertase Pin-like site-specific DNA recombinase
MGHVGIIFSIEMSRLARSCRDWHQLLENCSLFGTLLADADGVYDPRDHNDRLLLGLKGTMSEAELHVLQGRLRAGQLNKARRGEYFTHAPIGYVRSENTLVKSATLSTCSSPSSSNSDHFAAWCDTCVTTT